MLKKVLATLLAITASSLIATPAQAAPPSLTTAPTYSISGAVAVENFIYTNGVGTWSGATSYKFAYYKCTSAHTDPLSLPGDCTQVQAESSNSRYDIEAADLGAYIMAVVIGVNADGETPHYMDTVGPVAAQATHSCPLHYTTSGTGDLNTDCSKVVEDNSGTSGPLYHLFSGSYTIELEGGDGGSATYGGNTVAGGEGARVAFNISTPVYTWYTSYWNMSYAPGGDGQDSQRWADSYCADRTYTQGSGLYFSSDNGATESFGGAVSRFKLIVDSNTVAYAYAAGGGGAGCNGGAGGNAGGVSTSASDLSTTDTVYVAYGENGSSHNYEGGTVGGGVAETIAGGGSGGVGVSPSNTTTLQSCFDGQKQSGGGGSPAGGTFTSPYCGIFASDYYSGAAIAQHTYANAKIWEGGAGGGGFFDTFDGSYKNLSGYAGGHADVAEVSEYGGGGGAGGASVYKLGTADDTYFTSFNLGQNTRTTTQGSVSISFPAQPIPDEPTITSITAGAGGTVQVTVEAAATGVVGPQFQVFQQGGASSCTGIFDADTGVGTCTISGLTAGTSYSFAPRAYNIFGYSARGPVQSVTALGAAPVNTASPTITGTARVASTLTANAGTWTGASGSATYKWFVCDQEVTFASTTLVSTAPYNCVQISGATSSTYQLTSSEQGKYVLVGETRVASDGAPGTKFSISTAAVAAAPSAPTIPYITISGSRMSGSTLTVSTTTTGDPTLSYAWYSCTAAVNFTGSSLPAGCTLISGATSSSYLQTDNEIGKYVGLMITATNGVAPDYVASSGAPVVTNAGVPSLAAPTGVIASAGNASATVSWNSVSGATGYVVTSSPGGITCSTSTTSCNVIGLTNGVAYTFTVVATSGATSSAPSSASSSVTPSAGGSAPATPTGVSASAGNASATVSWSAVSGASTYTVTASPGGQVCSSAGTSCVVGGLTNGVAYTFTVYATNGYGNSASSSASSSVTPSAGSGPAPSNGPSAPKATAGNGSATLSWLPVFGAVAYKVTSLPAGAGCETITTTCTITGLVNGTNYFFTVYAVYANGSLSQPSAMVGPITPFFDPNDPGQDPKLDFITPKSPVEPGVARTTTGGKNTVTTSSSSSGSHELKLNFGNPGNGLVKLSGFMEDSDSVLPLRKISGLKSLVLENNSLLKLRGDGYGEKTQIQFHLQNVSTGFVVYLGQTSVKKGGSFEFSHQLDGNLAAGNYVLQINGFVFKNLEYKLRSTNVGTVVIDSAVQRVYFKPDSSKLTKTAKKEIADNLEMLKASPFLTMYSYTTGEVTPAFQEINKALAKKRATTLKEYLVKLGVEENAIRIKVVGAVIPKNLSEPWRNRRVDIYIKL